MSLPIGRVQKRKIWQDHVRACKEFKGSQKTYCEENNINPRTLSLYKSRFKNKKLKVTEKQGKFSKVVVVPKPISAGSDRIALPDPVWTARFLKAWTQI